MLTISVQIEKGSHGQYYATSHDLRGLLAIGISPDDLMDGIPEAITSLFAAEGRAVTVARLESDIWGIEFDSSADWENNS